MIDDAVVSYESEPGSAECHVVTAAVKSRELLRPLGLIESSEFYHRFIAVQTWIWQWKGKLHYINPKGKFILPPQEQRQETLIQSLIGRTNKRNWHIVMVTHPSTNWGRCCLTPLYQAFDCSSMPITTDKKTICKFLLLRKVSLHTLTVFVKKNVIIAENAMRLIESLELDHI